MVTIQDIADELGVSRNTVSKVFNNKTGVSEFTREQIIKKAVEMGYSKLPIELANEQVKDVNESLNISVIVTEPEISSFWMRMLNSIANELHENEDSLVYNFIFNNNKNEFKIPPIISNKQVAGIIIFNVYDERTLKVLSETGIPVVYYDSPINMTPGQLKGDVILTEGFWSIYDITQHMISNGAEKIGFIGDITYSKSIHDRWRGFKAALQDNNIEIDKRFCLTKGPVNHFYESDEVERLLDTVDELPEAFICANDVIAYRVIKHLRQKGIIVPRDIAISGYDNIKEPLNVNTSLTTVDADIEYIGKRIVDQLYRRIDEGDNPFETVTISSNIVYRESTEGEFYKDKKVL